jgi:hypothetical protein
MEPLIKESGAKQMLPEPWFTDLESRWLRGAEAEATEDRARVEATALYPGIMTDGVPLRLGDRPERSFPCRLETGTQRHVRFYVYGRSRPMTKAELRIHFIRQIEDFLGSRRNEFRRNDII